MDSDIRELYQDGRNRPCSGCKRPPCLTDRDESVWVSAKKRRRIWLGRGHRGNPTVLLRSAGWLWGICIRAVFMVFCSFLASYLGRTYDLLSAMALSLSFTRIRFPYLLFTSGLQLSYRAVGAVGLAGNMKIHGSPLFTAMSASIAIQIVTLPVILYHFFEFPFTACF